MTWIAASAAIGGALIGGGASLWAANTQANAAKDAAKLQSDATNRSLDIQKQIYDQQREDLQPWRQSGVNALARLNELSDDESTFGMTNFKQDPGYAFRLSEGLKAIQRSAAARGGLLSGATMKGIGDYSQGLASQEYQNAFNRYQVEKQAKLNQLQALAGIGQNANQQVIQSGNNYADNSGNLIVGGANALAQGQIGAANANASGYMGTANTLNNAIGSYVNYNQNQALLNRLMPENTTNNSNYYSPQQTRQNYIEPFEF
jgi:hypothetical protein